MFRKLFLLVCAAAVLVSCGTDTKPSYFTNIVRSDADIDALTACLTETPQVDGDTLTIKSSIPCLTERCYVYNHRHLEDDRGIFWKFINESMKFPQRRVAND